MEPAMSNESHPAPAVSQAEPFVPHARCKTPDKCRRYGVCFDAWACSSGPAPQAEPADRCRSSETSDPKATGPMSPERTASNREDAAATVAAGSGEQAEPIDPHMIVADDRFPDEQAEPKREALTDERITKGEYVFATKWDDGDPGDHWGVGFYDRFENGRHYVVDSAGKQIRGNGFRRVGRITVDVGRWLLSAGKSLEASPPGTVNLWTMLTERARRIGGSDADR